MKKISIKILFIFLIFISNSITSCKNNIWNLINNSSWYGANGWAGCGLVFYETYSGKKKVLHQIYGSGLAVVSSSIYDIDINENTIISSSSKEELGRIDISKDSITIIFIFSVYSFQSDKPIICSNGKSIDISILKEEKLTEDIIKSMCLISEP